MLPLLTDEQFDRNMGSIIDNLIYRYPDTYDQHLLLYVVIYFAIFYELIEICYTL